MNGVDGLWVTNNYGNQVQIAAGAGKVHNVNIIANRLVTPFNSGISCVFDGNSGPGLVIENVLIADNYIESPQDSGIYVGNDSTRGDQNNTCRHIVIRNNFIKGLYVHSKGSNCGIILRAVSVSEDWLIEGNVATGVNPDGTGPGNNSIGIKIDPPDKFTGIVRRLSINNNHVHDFQYAGIQVVPRVVNFAMRGNLVEGAEGILIISQAFGDRQPML